MGVVPLHVFVAGPGPRENVGLGFGSLCSVGLVLMVLMVLMVLRLAFVNKPSVKHILEYV
jgi:hypothetical protein